MRLPNCTAACGEIVANSHTLRSLGCACSTKPNMGPKAAYVYAGEGAGQRSMLSAKEALENALDGVKVQLLETAELLHGKWQQDCILLCMPGGADLPYCRQLNGVGNALIADYVASGGSYLGLCAGAYYACSRIEFEPGTELEVCGARELAFFHGTARGAVYPGFAYQTEAGTRAAALRFKASSSGEWQACRDYSNGGPAFLRDTAEAAGEASELAQYQDGQGPAAVRCPVGVGVAVLCGTHPELGPRWLDGACSAAAVAAAHPNFGAEKVERLVETAVSVQRALEDDAAARKQFWHLLLSKAGLRRFLRT